jgi:hypothetical protein
MEDSGNVEKDTTTGFPAGYQPPQPQESQGAVLDFVTGTVSSAITSTVNTRQFGEYGKFLDYCVYRTLPFGETGEEDSAVGDAEHDWKTGKKCMELGGEMSYFRIYTLDKAIQDADDGLTDSTTAFSGSDTPVSYTSDSVTVHPSPLDSYVLPRQVFGVLQSYRSRSVYA